MFLRSVIGLSALFSSLSVFADGRKISCHSVIEVPDLGGMFETKVDFNETTPSLVRTIVAKPSTGIGVTERQSFLSATEACGVSVAFSNFCTFESESTSPLKYQFRFNCLNGVKGEFSLNGNEGFFTCTGKGVNPDLPAGIYFQRCH